MKVHETYYSTVSICMPMILLVSAFLMQGINHTLALPASSLLMVMITAACAGIICGIEGLVKHENMKWMSVAGMAMNAFLVFICYAILQAL
ncbi:MAG TPA: hypothetical protein DCZ94_14420 [Lentisphaeria bacterium]|nr:MAG: hypothetical protein A2X48_03465 [Lentisphaerae bacterium GWF2_49_21]HBC88141.1 hypothetical protein [Lentisphaeria bacterium]